MAIDSAPIPSGSGEYEFSGEHNQVIASLARKMSLVGFALMVFGGLQMFNGILSLFTTRNPERVITAARDAGMPAERLQQLETTLTSGTWLSPLTISSLVFALTGLFMLLVGLWTQQSAAGFAGVAHTRGQDVRRLMDALGSLHRTYALISALLWLAAIAAIISIAFALYHRYTPA